MVDNESTFDPHLWSLAAGVFRSILSYDGGKNIGPEHPRQSFAFSTCEEPEDIEFLIFQMFPNYYCFGFDTFDIIIGGSRTACHCVSFTCHNTNRGVYQRAT